MYYNWNWGIFWEMFFDGIFYIDMLLVGLKWILVIVVCVWIMVLILGIIFGILCIIIKFWVVCIVNGYVELFCNILLLV